MSRDLAPDFSRGEPLPVRKRGLPKVARFAVLAVAAAGATGAAPAASAEASNIHSPNHAHTISPEAQATYRLHHGQPLLAVDGVLVIKAREHVGAAKAPATSVGATEYSDDMADVTEYVTYPVMITADMKHQKQITSPSDSTDGKVSFGYIDRSNCVRIIPDSEIVNLVPGNYTDHYGFSFAYSHKLSNGGINYQMPVGFDGVTLTNELGVPMPIGQLNGVAPPELQQ